MNSRNSFSSLTITQLVIHLTGALLELYADDTQEIQVMASGDDHDMKAVSLAQNGDTLTLEQSAAALSPLPLSARWLQVTIRIPRAWKGRVEIRTTSGSVHVRGLQVSDLSVESLSGFVMLSDLSSLSLKVKNGRRHCRQRPLRSGLQPVHDDGDALSGAPCVSEHLAILGQPGRNALLRGDVLHLQGRLGRRRHQSGNSRRAV